LAPRLGRWNGPGARRLGILAIGGHGNLGAPAPTCDRVRPGRGSSASGGLAGARHIASHRIAAAHVQRDTPSRVPTGFRSFEEASSTLSWEDAYRVGPDLPTNCGSPVWRRGDFYGVSVAPPTAQHASCRGARTAAPRHSRLGGRSRAPPSLRGGLFQALARRGVRRRLVGPVERLADQGRTQPRSGACSRLPRSVMRSPTASSNGTARLQRGWIGEHLIRSRNADVAIARIGGSGRHHR
jgi:hypothetical protein